MIDLYAEVIINSDAVQIDRPFTYKVRDEDNESIQVGHRVKVPFGNGNRSVEGFVIGLKCDGVENIKRIKKITCLLDKEPILSRDDLKLIFTPHLVPMNRGILVTAYANLAKDVTYEDVKAAYDKYYDKEYFVRVLPKDVCPETRWVEGSNFVDIGFKIEPRTNRIIAMGALDNLVKGAAGQAVQNMNLLFGFEENEGLKIAPMFP